RSASANVNAASVVWVNTISGVFCHNLGIVTELAAYLFNHALSSSAHSADCQCTKEENQCNTQQCRNEDRDISEIDGVDGGIVIFSSVENIKVSAEKQESCKSCGTNTVAFRQCLRGVAHTVQRVGNVTYSLGTSAHLSNATGVISNGAKSVHSQNIRSTHQHTHCGNSSTEDTSGVDYMGNAWI